MSSLRPHYFLFPEVVSIRAYGLGAAYFDREALTNPQKGRAQEIALQ